ncbi:hypothetical protein FOWG_15860 [Fusarium oxysporum f. sp. lycopersici MN25]|nr:hypothetical protein FOWG_15860 [Fusarium oxysporum f. sp. lycopersici MN25]
MCYSLTSSYLIPCPASPGQPVQVRARSQRRRCQQQRPSRREVGSSSRSPVTRSEHKQAHLQHGVQSSECVGHPLGDVNVFQTSAIASTLSNETESSHSTCHADAPCHLHDDQETLHRSQHTSTQQGTISKCQDLGVSHKRSRRKSYQSRQCHQHRQDMWRWQENALPAKMSCTSCHTNTTPQWREGPSGPRTLCNFCGLIYAKRQQKHHAGASSHCFSSD